MSVDASDAELLRRARFHDQGAWRALYERHLPMAWRYAVRQADCVQDAEDLVSEAMLALLRSLDRPGPATACVAAWLRTVIRNKAADLIRRKSRHRRALESHATTLDGASPYDREPEAALQRVEHGDEVTRLLDELPDRQQIVLELKYYEGLSVREIAERQGESDKAIEALLYRARREFRRRYDHLHGESPAAAPPSWPTGKKLTDHPSHYPAPQT